MACVLDFQNPANAHIDENGLKNHLDLILRRLDMVATVGIEISVVKDSAVQQLNARYLHHNQPTDVLSFNNPNFGSNTKQPLGSLVFAEGVATKQAGEANITLQREVETLAGHGLLHLLCYNHH